MTRTAGCISFNLLNRHSSTVDVLLTIRLLTVLAFDDSGYGSEGPFSLPVLIGSWITVPAVNQNRSFNPFQKEGEMNHDQNWNRMPGGLGLL